MPISDLAPFATAAGTVVAAAITGFAAAALKRRWDIADEQRRWLRQAAQQQRLELTSAWTNYLTARRELAALVQRWAVAMVRHQAPAASDRDRARWPQPPDETEIVAANMRLAQGAEELELRVLSIEAIRLIRRDSQVAQAYGLGVIDLVRRGQEFAPLVDCGELSTQIRRDLTELLGANSPRNVDLRRTN